MKNLEEKKYWIWLSLIPNLGNKKIQELLRVYKNPKTIYQLKEKELVKVSGIGEKIAKNILDEKIRGCVIKHIEYMNRNEIDIISIYDKEYPQLLKKIYDAPISLYCKGNTKILNQRAIGIVGCRDASEYGKSAAKYFSYHLTKRGFYVISGLAKGIDRYAHIGSICGRKEGDLLKEKGQEENVCGNTIAVVGNGLDIVYPKENELLAKQIIERGGTIVSEYPLGTKPEKMNFPARNRIISGMSKGILVIEAKEKSGTLITVDFALEQGRDVFVVPGNINSICSVGTNGLLKQGAKLVTNYDEIF